MKFIGLCIAVKNIQKARAFYEEVLDCKVVSDLGKNISFDAGFSLQQDFDWLTSIPKDEILVKENNYELYFEVEDFDNFINKLSQRDDIVYLHQTKVAPWGQQHIRFYDIDSHLIEVGEELSTVVKRFKDKGNTLEEIAKIMDIPLVDVIKLSKDKPY